MINGVPDFYELQKRTLLTNRAKIELGAKRLPASFVAYDCLQVGERVLFNTPLLERKEILKELEGVVAKKASSLYYQGKRTNMWQLFRQEYGGR